jgi:hypothetical protein
MADYQKLVFVGGKWLDKSKLKTGMRAKIVSETNPEPSKFTEDDGTPKMQDVCQIKVEGLNDVSKVSLNRITINALVEAFGSASKSWIDKVLTIDLSKRDGKSYLYFVPEGYKCTQDTEGYTIIMKVIKEEPNIPVINEDSPTAVDDKSLPF